LKELILNRTEKQCPAVHCRSKFTVNEPGYE